MNTDVLALTAPGCPADLGAVEAIFRGVEARFSRFRADSELTRLNANPAAVVAASDEMLALLSVAQALHRRTGGIFDPAILPALERHGYDRSWEMVAAAGGGADRGARAAAVRSRGTVADLVLDRRAGTVRRAPGLRLDLGGIGKGYALDRAVRTAGGPLLVDAGGDIAARGSGGAPGEHDGGWVVSIADPFDGTRDIAVLQLRDEAIATSSTLRRRWQRGGLSAHHIIDPRDGDPARSGLAAVSVVAASAVEADVFAKAALILGERAGLALLEREGMRGLAVRDDGSHVTTGDWDELT
jgi:thiamine biosynthesis lipoprotein